MLSKSAARNFFLVGTVLCFGAFILLTIDTIKRVPAQTKAHNLTPEAIAGKHLWDVKNCMGCHTLFGEGAYYAPELTKVFDRRGEAFIKAMLKDPQAMYPGERKMTQYNFTDEEIDQLVAFLKWAGEVDLNGFPPEPDLAPQNVTGSGEVMKLGDRPQVYNQMCVACHSLNSQGGNIGPALDDIGSKMSRNELIDWIADPAKVKAGTTMPKLPLKPEEVKELAAFLSKLTKGKE